MTTSVSEKTAFVLGGTGAVGKALVRDLLKSSKYRGVTTVGRREVKLEEGIPTEKLTQKIVDFEKLEQYRENFKGYDDVFCCLGTTRAEAGGAAQFVRIDHDYVINAAKLIKEENPPKDGEDVSPVHFLYCSSAGANKTSMFLYPRTKGQIEDSLSHTGFAKVTIFQPGFLEIEEDRPRSRPGESLASKVFIPVANMLGFNASVPVGTVGRAMRRWAAGETLGVEVESKKNEAGTAVTVLTNAEIVGIGKQLDSSEQTT